MSDLWYYSKGGRVYGPVSRPELDDLYSRGEIASTDQVRKVDDTRWVSYSTIAHPSAATDEVTPVVATPVPRSRDTDHFVSSTNSFGSGDSSIPPKQPARSRLSILGIHPLVAFCLIVFDFMIFKGEVATGGLSVACLAPLAGVAVFVATILVQRHSCQDSWAAAAGKALLLGVLTAIPTPLPSFVTAALGGMGYLARRQTP